MGGVGIVWGQQGRVVRVRWGPGVRVGSGQGGEGSAGEVGAWGQGGFRARCGGECG